MENHRGISLFWHPPGGGLRIPYEEAYARAKIDPTDRILFPQGIELIQGLGQEFVQRVILPTRKDILEPKVRNTFLLSLISRTGAGKRTLASQLLFLFENDPFLRHYLATEEEGRREELRADRPVFTQRYIAFAETATLLRYRGGVPSSEGHGRYSAASYRKSSVEMFGFIAREFDHPNGPRLIITEHSAPSAYQTPDGTIEGSDRGYTTAKTIAKYLKDITRVVVIKREHDLYEKIVYIREKIADATSDTIANILEEGGLHVYKGRSLEDIRQLAPGKRQELIEELNLSWAPAAGVEKAQKEMDDRRDQLKEEGKIKTGSEQEMWEYILYTDMGFDPDRVMITGNPINPTGVSLHDELLRARDPLRAETIEKKYLKEGIGDTRLGLSLRWSRLATTTKLELRDLDEFTATRLKRALDWSKGVIL
jgi:hypothetical protein